jgi:SAM-dependent methyltransferase
MPPKRSALDLAEGLQLGHALSTLHDLGVLAALAKPQDVASLADSFKLDPALLGATLEFAAARSDLVVKRGQRFRASDMYDPSARFLLDLYAGAFAANAVALPQLLKRPARAGAAVDRARHARAFLHAPSGAERTPAALLAQLGVHGLFDLGCGPGALLRALAEHDPAFRGWGIDANPAMCRIARARLRESGVSRRVRILQGDGRDPARALPVKARAAIEAIVAGDLANELCANGTDAACAWLQRLRRDFPQRLLLVSDYYGRLGQGGADSADRETLLHDYVQAISGQGIPPPDRRAWQALYRSAGARMIHCLEDISTTRFLHLVQL